LLDVSGAFKTPAKEGFPESTLSSAFQEIYLGCCTVAAQLSNSFLVDDYPFLGDPVTSSRLTAIPKTLTWGEFWRSGFLHVNPR
jgi:hypothetical protein